MPALELANGLTRRLLGAGDDLVRQQLDVLIALAVEQAPTAVCSADAPLDTCAARSPNTWSGVRTLRRMMSCKTLFGSPALIELEHGDPQAFLVHVARAGAHAVAADIGVMDGRAEEADELALVERRHDDGDVEEVAGGEPRDRW